MRARSGWENWRVDLAAVVSALLAECETPGAAIGFVDGTERTIVAAGERGAGRGPVEDDTLFAAASLTKPVFAAGVMALVDDGVLELDRPLSEYLPEPYLPEDHRAASITARMVLSHTTGFPNWREGSDDRVHPSGRTAVPTVAAGDALGLLRGRLLLPPTRHRAALRGPGRRLHG